MGRQPWRTECPPCGPDEFCDKQGFPQCRKCDGGPCHPYRFNKKLCKKVCPGKNRTSPLTSPPPPSPSLTPTPSPPPPLTLTLTLAIEAPDMSLTSGSNVNMWTGLVVGLFVLSLIGSSIGVGLCVRHGRRASRNTTTSGDHTEATISEDDGDHTEATNSEDELDDNKHPELIRLTVLSEIEDVPADDEKTSGSAVSTLLSPQQHQAERPSSAVGEAAHSQPPPGDVSGDVKGVPPDPVRSRPVDPEGAGERLDDVTAQIRSPNRDVETRQKRLKHLITAEHQGREAFEVSGESTDLIANYYNRIRTKAPETVASVGSTAGTPSVSRTAGTPSVSRTAGTPSVSRTAGTPSVSRTAGTPSVSRTAGTPSVSRTAGTPSVSCTEGTPSVGRTVEKPSRLAHPLRQVASGTSSARRDTKTKTRAQRRDVATTDETSPMLARPTCRQQHNAASNHEGRCSREIPTSCRRSSQNGRDIPNAPTMHAQVTMVNEGQLARRSTGRPTVNDRVPPSVSANSQSGFSFPEPEPPSNHSHSNSQTTAQTTIPAAPVHGPPQSLPSTRLDVSSYAGSNG